MGACAPTRNESEDQGKKPQSPQARRRPAPSQPAPTTNNNIPKTFGGLPHLDEAVADTPGEAGQVDDSAIDPRLAMSAGAAAPRSNDTHTSDPYRPRERTTPQHRKRDSLMPVQQKNAEIMCRFRIPNRNEAEGEQCVLYGDVNMESEQKDQDDWEAVEDEMGWDELTKEQSVCEVHTPKSYAKGKYHDFQFDRLFPPNCKNRNLYSVMRNQWIPALMGGTSIGVIPYGVSGSGKSYTVHGTPNDPGIVPLFCADLFKRLPLEPDAEDCKVTVRCTFVEIYQDKIVDLLRTSEGCKKVGLATNEFTNKRDRPTTSLEPGRGLVIRHDVTKIFSSSPVPDANDIECTTADEMVELFWKGAKRLRKEKMTDREVQWRSSRSHSIFIVTLERENEETGVSTASQFYVVDVAGPFVRTRDLIVKDKKSLNKLNQQLVAFRKVLLFSDKRNTGRHKPYRDSKITLLLQNVLSQGKTCIFLNVSGATEQAKNTIETLRFGLKACKLAKRKIQTNRTMRSALEVISDAEPQYWGGFSDSTQHSQGQTMRSDFSMFTETDAPNSAPNSGRAQPLPEPTIVATTNNGESRDATYTRDRANNLASTATSPGSNKDEPSKDD